MANGSLDVGKMLATGLTEFEYFKPYLVKPILGHQGGKSMSEGMERYTISINTSLGQYAFNINVYKTFRAIYY